MKNIPPSFKPSVILEAIEGGNVIDFYEYEWWPETAHGFVLPRAVTFYTNVAIDISGAHVLFINPAEMVCGHIMKKHERPDLDWFFEGLSKQVNVYKMLHM